MTGRQPSGCRAASSRPRHAGLALTALGFLLSSCNCGSSVPKCGPSNCTGCCTSASGPLSSHQSTCLGLDLQTTAACGQLGEQCGVCPQGRACVVGGCVIEGFDGGGPFDGGSPPACVADSGFVPDAGCATPADCPCGSACDASGHCTLTCFAAQPCNVGCCSLAGTCVVGTSASACGSDGGACTDCTMTTAHSCAPVSGGGTCGCATNGDCGPGTVCDPVTHACTNACGGQGQQCCEPGGCGMGLFCTQGLCQPCGGENQPCCPDGTCSTAGSFACQSGTCVACGGLQEPCCPGNACAQPVCCLNEVCVPVTTVCPGTDGGACQAGGSCGACGGLGQPCCASVGGDAGYCSASASFCDAGTCQGCGAYGSPCCPTANPGNACSNSNTQVCSVGPGCGPGSAGPCCGGGDCGFPTQRCCQTGGCANDPSLNGAALCSFADAGNPVCL